ncbi:lantibiotic immunity ABC transporter MutG family permease subunit [Paramaledivibacter caminithermalis]|jgi:ABC-2 type transport system permease protein|uniref:ABC-2 type transport system permease protein n=1 Tax=Paramaledivibacter caminithermalis (strain DSM 15212 / CIP 107654 / DViRD3) TaxID=1121301 RepID=A0A1M6TJI6_PARC5|nr:lantibiotic immunity ABC transporter MutG family permease subunit [Paramaledivibacter caminithermalis]SHK57084.1 ABC-2 type transport system permease protein [Paramaledivibacter caminithermalis DSM 15212]
MNIFISEWIKIKRTPILWLTFLIPVIFAALMIWYFSLRTITINTQILIFQAFFDVWTALIIPLGVGLISGLMIHQEELAGSFNGFLGSKLLRRDLYLGKLTMLILLTSASTLFAVLTLLVGLSFILNIHISWTIFIIAAIMAMIGTLPLLAFHLWISFACGMGASIGIGGGGILVAALMATSLGNKIWQYVPWAWPVRLTELAGVYLLNLHGMKNPLEIISSVFIVEQAIKGLIPAAVFFVSLLAGGLIWFERWEGRKMYG